MSAINAARAHFAGHLCETVSIALAKVDPAELTEDQLKTLCCQVHQANTYIDLFRTQAAQLLANQTPTQET